MLINGPGPVPVTIPTAVVLTVTGTCFQTCAPPYSATVVLTANCTPGGMASSAPVMVQVNPGINPVPVPLVLPGVGPRVCVISGSVTVTLAGPGCPAGTLIARGPTEVCVVEPAPGNPTVPRLDLSHVAPPGGEIVRVHPGDRASMKYRITNHDPCAAFTGMVRVDMRNVAILPEGTSAARFAVADPAGKSEHFPIEFGDDLCGMKDPCPILPPIPQNQLTSERLRPILLQPGESRIIDIVARPWSMCANGSCGESLIKITGSFTDGSKGLACAGAVVVADTTVPPERCCADSGAAVKLGVLDPVVGMLSLDGEPLAGQPWQATLSAKAAPPVEVRTTAIKLADTYGRISQTVIGNPPLPGVPLTVPVQLQFMPGRNSPKLTLQKLMIDVIPNAPAGVHDSAPIAKGTAALSDGNRNSTLEIFYQLSASSSDGHTPKVSMRLTPAAGGFTVAATIVPAPDFRPPLVIHHDFRAFAVGLVPAMACAQGAPCPPGPDGGVDGGAACRDLGAADGPGGMVDLPPTRDLPVGGEAPGPSCGGGGCCCAVGARRGSGGLALSLLLGALVVARLGRRRRR